MSDTKAKRAVTYIAGAAAIAVAYLCRLPIGEQILSGKAGYLRSFIYIAFFFVWGISVRRRIIHPQIRRYMTAIAALIVFWFVIRSLKYNFISVELYPHTVRYIWYLFYVPMILVPFLAVLVSFSIGKPENYRLPKKAVLLFIPSFLLIAAVLTNDLHGLVFTFPEGAEVWTDSDYGYAFIYCFIIIWLFLCAITVLFTLCHKRRASNKHRLILIPCIPTVILLVYSFLYFTQVGWLRFVFGDVTAFTCLSYMITLELCIDLRFIQSNSGYMELFDASTVGAQITDNDYNVLMSSKTAIRQDKELLRKTREGSVMLENGLRLSGAPIRRGHVVWTEDVSDLTRVLDELSEVKEELKDSNGILEEENKLKAREAQIEEQKRLYDMIGRSTARQICMTDELIDQARNAASEEERIHILKKILTVGTYLKRRSNLVFLTDGKETVDAKELALTFRESLESLELCGIVCGFRSELTGQMPSEHLTAMYDFFEEITERSFADASAMMIIAGKDGNAYYLRITTDSAADVSDLMSDTVTAEKDTDGETRITLRLPEGGESA